MLNAYCLNLRDVAAADASLAIAGSAKLRTMFDAKHSFAFLYTAHASKKQQWIYPLHHFHESCVLALKLKLCEVKPFRYFEIQTNSEPYMCSILKLTRSDKCVSVVARSWLWQVASVPQLRKGKEPAIRLCAVGPTESPMQGACRSAFWLMCNATLNFTLRTSR